MMEHKIIKIKRLDRVALQIRLLQSFDWRCTKITTRFFGLFGYKLHMERIDRFHIEENMNTQSIENFHKVSAYIISNKENSLRCNQYVSLKEAFDVKLLLYQYTIKRLNQLEIGGKL